MVHRDSRPGALRHAAERPAGRSHMRRRECAFRDAVRGRGRRSPLYCRHVEILAGNRHVRGTRRRRRQVAETCRQSNGSLRARRRFVDRIDRFSADNDMFSTFRHFFETRRSNRQVCPICRFSPIFSTHQGQTANRSTCRANLSIQQRKIDTKWAHVDDADGSLRP